MENDYKVTIDGKTVSVRIDPELQEFIPDLSRADLQEVRNSLSKYGYDKAYRIVLWQPDPDCDDAYIVDGHHRFTLCGELKIELDGDCFLLRDFENKEAVIDYMTDLRFSGRTRTPYEEYLVAKKWWDYFKAKGKENMAAGGKGLTDMSKVNARKLAARKVRWGEGTLAAWNRVMKSSYNDLKEGLKTGLYNATRADDMRRKREKAEEKREYDKAHLWDSVETNERIGKIIFEMTRKRTHKETLDYQIDALEQEMRQIFDAQDAVLRYKRDTRTEIEEDESGRSRLYDIPKGYKWKIFLSLPPYWCELYYGVVAIPEPDPIVISRVPNKYVEEFKQIWRRIYQETMGDNDSMAKIDALPEEFRREVITILESAYDFSKFGKKYTRKRRGEDYGKTEYVHLLGEILGVSS